MITQLKGNVDGKSIIFSQTEEGLWETIVPLDLDGTYVIDLTAEDEAGNSSYYATVLFIVDSETLQIKLILLKYYLGYIRGGYHIQGFHGYFFKQIWSAYILLHKNRGYHLERGCSFDLQ